MATGKINEEGVRGVGLEKIIPNLSTAVLDKAGGVTIIAGGSLNIEVLNIKNEDRLKMLDKLASGDPNDKLNKLDTMLINMMSNQWLTTFIMLLL